MSNVHIREADGSVAIKRRLLAPKQMNFKKCFKRLLTPVLRILGDMFSCPGSSIPAPCKDNRQEPVDNRQAPVDNRQEPVDNRQEPLPL